MTKIKVCHLSSVHLFNDTRILYRECQTLSRNYDVTLVIPANKDMEIGKVHIKSVRKFQSRCLRIFVTIPMVLYEALNSKAKIYHFHDPELIGVGLVLKLLKRIVIIDIHEDYSFSFTHKKYLSKYSGKILQMFYTIILYPLIKYFDAIVVAWPMIGNKLLQDNIFSTLIQNFPSLSYFPEKCTPTIKSSDKIIRFVFTGAITKERGIYEVFDFMEKCIQKGLNVSIDFYGRFNDDEMEKYFYFRSKQLKKVKYNGWISPTDLFDTLKIYDFGFIFFHPIPNHIHSEPNKLFEFWAARVIPIVSKLPTLSSYINCANSGLTIDIFNMNKEFDKILPMLSDYSWQNINAKNGRDMILNKYNWDEESKKLVELYNRIIRE
jgi:glycosyltransferase involved in cell wall biosynthesis